MKTYLPYLITIFLSCIAFAEEDHLVQMDTTSFEKQVGDFNKELIDLRNQLQEKFQKAAQLFEKKAKENEYKELLSQIEQIQSKIKELQKSWKESCVQEGAFSSDGYAYWDQGETTLSQLIMEYGSSEYLYVIPHELSTMKLHMYSTIPLPQESWSEMIEMILAHNGIGIKQINPYLRQLYIVKHEPVQVSGIAQSLQELKRFSESSWIMYLFSPPPEQLKAMQSFFDRFSDPKKTTVQIVGSKIVIVSSKSAIERLLQLQAAVWDKDQGKVVRVIPLHQMQPKEAEKVLTTYFQEPAIKSRPSFFHSGADELLILPQASSIVVIGSGPFVKKAEAVIEDLENQLEPQGEKTIFWYTCKHSDPEELAEVLNQVYTAMCDSNLTFAKEGKNNNLIPNSEKNSLLKRRLDKVMRDNAESKLPIAPKTITPGSIDKEKKETFYGDFIVDNKTGSLVIVIKREYLSQIKQILTKLDVPKKMVQIDVLLVEKQIEDNKQTGINLLKIGASDGQKTAVEFDHNKRGILDFIVSRPTSFLPAFDFTARFLLAREDVRISSNPSITAVNQTPAQIIVQEERSVLTGVDPEKKNAYQSYDRKQFGVNIVMTPTILLSDEENEEGFVYLQTDIEFDTEKKGSSPQDRPLVIRRVIKNEVQIADGETIILGGLRTQSQEDEREKIPFLGDIPGVGKLFGTTKLADKSSEMFIFITPHIIKNPIDDLARLRKETLKKRAGDIPEWLEKIEEAKKEEKKKLFENSLQLVMDREDK